MIDPLTPRPSCRACGGDLTPVLALGSPVLSDFPLPGDPDPIRAPLSLVQCDRCDLVQLEHTVDPDLLYREAYWYRSGINPVMVAELQDVVQHATDLVPTGFGSIVLDVGCNDGTLLAQYSRGLERIGVEPSLDLSARAAIAAPNATILNDFFPRGTQALDRHSVSILTSIAIFYDLDDPRSFVEEVDRLLAPDGVWIVQMQDLKQMVDKTAFDNICHEHLCYYTPDTFSALLDGYDLALTEIRPRAINGGSLRFVVRRRAGLQQQVKAWEVTHHQLQQFAWRVGQVQGQIRGAVDRILSRHGWIDLYAASTKSSTLLQTCGIGRAEIRCAVERTPEKVGRETSGTRIPIISEEDWRKSPAPITLQGAWQYKDAFVEREAEYLRQGGAFLVPLPAVEVIYGRA